jgi:hypothetical protein
MSTLVVVAAENGETWGGVNHWAVGAVVLAILMVSLGALVAFGGGREHS